MRPYVVLLINANYLARMVFETLNTPRNIFEAYYHTHLPFNSSLQPNHADVSLRNPVSMFFADTEESAKTLAISLAQTHPGTTWQWFKTMGTAGSKATPIPLELITVKAITEKGLLP